MGLEPEQWNITWTLMTLYGLEGEKEKYQKDTEGQCKVDMTKR